MMRRPSQTIVLGEGKAMKETKTPKAKDHDADREETEEEVT